MEEVIGSLAVAAVVVSFPLILVEEDLEVLMLEEDLEVVGTGGGLCRWSSTSSRRCQPHQLDVHVPTRLLRHRFIFIFGATDK